AECARLAVHEGMTEIPPFDHSDVIAGQGTIGLELLEDFPELDTVVVPVSGGGLISGIACALKAASASVRIVGVSMQPGAAMHASISEGWVAENAGAVGIALLESWHPSGDHRYGSECRHGTISTHDRREASLLKVAKFRICVGPVPCRHSKSSVRVDLNSFRG